MTISLAMYAGGGWLKDRTLTAAMYVILISVATVKRENEKSSMPISVKEMRRLDVRWHVIITTNRSTISAICNICCICISCHNAQTTLPMASERVPSCVI